MRSWPKERVMGLVNELRGSRIRIDTAPFIYLSGTRPQSRTTELGTFGTNVPLFRPILSLGCQYQSGGKFYLWQNRGDRNIGKKHLIL